MGVALAVFVLGMILVGFTMLTLLPVLFIWLAVGVYTEPWETAPSGSLADTDTPAPAELEPPVAEPERPRVMAAGRRRPL